MPEPELKPFFEQAKEILELKKKSYEREQLSAQSIADFSGPIESRPLTEKLRHQPISFTGHRGPEAMR
ncbi:MAG: hypothetical protein CO189_10015 [candidate division Zixibacteria bacterium CG_4_9_14_3_um_filter_46_8]|nr:MAG: hypothetical protein CO189_10015 [candidate division Zixibacteria bacterium CG_4_9_14_3_um_filter_46_8]